MNKRPLAVLLCSLVLVAAAVSESWADEKHVQWASPVIAGYGYMNPLPEAALQPDANKQYRVVFDITKGGDSAAAVNRGLWYVARVLNLFGSAGVPSSNLQIAAVIHGAATKAVLKDHTYKARFGKENPNRELIEKLEAAGVKLYVCGQAIADNGYYYQNVRDDVEVVLGALAAEIELATTGYVLIKL
jgi:intracellular sulfur oxidation DsrE/DsrF family protein